MGLYSSAESGLNFWVGWAHLPVETLSDTNVQRTFELDDSLMNDFGHDLQELIRIERLHQPAGRTGGLAFLLFGVL